MLDKQIKVAFGESKKPEIKDEGGFELVYRIGADGKLEQTKQSKLDEESYEKEKKEKVVEKADDLDLDGRIEEALGKRGYNDTKYL